ncbi:MAG TPA: chemotaxis protein CheB [Thermomicrobiales bacterium]|nr:chemotaxis protein CheB [Thermomicrobiales bacterium]
MATRDIVVIGASAGGLQALTTVVASLPADFPGALFIVLHIQAAARSRLPEILARAGPLPVETARDGMPIRAGQIVVAPPDRHLIIEPGRIELRRGPRENHSRPAVDPLFRSAARAYGPRVVGVVLSGALYDGSAGLMAIQARGGVAIVQDPEEAMFASMPLSALRLVPLAEVLPAAEIAPALVALARTPIGAGAEATMADEIEQTVENIREDFVAQADGERPDEVSIYTCPDCGGVMWQVAADPPLQFRCHVGHAYAPELLLSLKGEEIEAALWRSVRLLKEQATLSRQMARNARLVTDNEEQAARIDEQAETSERHAAAIVELLEAMPTPGGELSPFPISGRPLA